jgi:nitrogenase subunit NifH
LKKESAISFKSISAIYGKWVIFASVIGIGFTLYAKFEEQKKQMINGVVNQIKPELQALKQDIAKANLQLEFARKRDTMQMNALNRYRISQAKTEREQIEIYKDIQKQLEQRQEYFYNEKMQISPEQLYFDSIELDTLKKKLQYRMTASES